MEIFASILLGFICSGFCIFSIFSISDKKTFSDLILNTTRSKLVLLTALFDIFVLGILLVFSFVFNLSIFYYILGVFIMFLILKFKFN